MNKRICASILSLALLTMLFTTTSVVTAFATGNVTVEVIQDDGQSSGDGNRYNGNSSDSTNSKPSSSAEIPEAVGDILNGEDHASKLFGTDKFKPAEVDTSWTQPLVDVISALASLACTFFGVFTLLKCVIDPITIIWAGFGKGLYHLHLSFAYSDLAAALAGLPLPEGRTAETVNDMPPGKPGKLVYWLKDALLTGIIGGALLIGVATGLLPDLINMGVNAIINGILWGVDWIKAL